MKPNHCKHFFSFSLFRSLACFGKNCTYLSYFRSENKKKNFLVCTFDSFSFVQSLAWFRKVNPDSLDFKTKRRKWEFKNENQIKAIFSILNGSHSTITTITDISFHCRTICELLIYLTWFLRNRSQASELAGRQQRARMYKIREIENNNNQRAKTNHSNSHSHTQRIGSWVENEWFAW